MASFNFLMNIVVTENKKIVENPYLGLLDIVHLMHIHLFF